MKKTISLLLFAFVCFATQAQTLDSSVTNNYPKSVVNRVYGVAIKTTLSIADQQNLADLFQDEENDINTLVLSGASAAAIENVRNSYKADFNAILSSTQLAQFYKASVAPKANTTASLTAAMLRNKYNVDTVMQQYFDSIIYWREAAIQKVWLRDSDSTTRNNNLAGTIYVYDSLLNVYIGAAASGNYFASRVHFLDSIQHIDSTKKVALATVYYGYCIQYKNKAYADNFNAALTTIFNNISDSPYYAALYKNEIQSKALNTAATSLSAYIRENKISTYAAQQITPILKIQQRIVALINKIYPTYTYAKDSITDTLTYSYQHQIDSIIGQDHRFNNSSQIAIAIKYAYELGLTSSQVTDLNNALLTLSDLTRDYAITNPDAEYDSKTFESENLNNILTANQYTQVLTVKYSGVATSMANKDWDELVLHDLSSNYTQAETKTALTNYHLAALIAYYRNANDAQTQYSAVHSINQMKPAALSALLELWDTHTPYYDSADTFFQW